jgi:hypothetical protein
MHSAWGEGDLTSGFYLVFSSVNCLMAVMPNFLMPFARAKHLYAHFIFLKAVICCVLFGDVQED